MNAVGRADFLSQAKCSGKCNDAVANDDIFHERTLSDETEDCHEE